MLRRATKIVATLGPASSDIDMREAMIIAGVNVVRLNFSHGKAHALRRADCLARGLQAPGSALAAGAGLDGRCQLLPGIKNALARRSQPVQISLERRGCCPALVV